MRATLAVFLLVATPVLAVLGDLNKDGTVDLEDFFIFADNFGKAGAPEAAGDLRFDGAYWRILGGEIEWLRFYTTGVVQHMITASFSPGSMGEYLYPSSPVGASGFFKRDGAKITVPVELSSKFGPVRGEYGLTIAAGDRLLQAGISEFDFVRFRDGMSSAEFLPVGSSSPDTDQVVVHDTVQVVLRDTLYIPFAVHDTLVEFVTREREIVDTYRVFKGPILTHARQLGSSFRL